MNEFEINNKLSEIIGYICSKYFHPEQAKEIYEEKTRLEKMLEDLKNDPQEKTKDKRKEN